MLSTATTRDKGGPRMPANYSICLGTAGWGVWNSPDSGQSWTRHRAPFPLNSRIQALVAHPTQPHTVLAGGDTGLFASYDGGLHWERLNVDIAAECSIGTPFVTGLVVDPDDHRRVWAGVEIDGIFRSLDGGDTWTHQKTGL